MNIGEIGNRFITTEKINYASNKNFIDYDMIIIDINQAMTHMARQYRAQLEKRQGELTEFIEHKNIPLVVFAPDNDSMHLQDGSYLDYNGLLPFGDFVTVAQQGRNVNILKNTLFSDFLNSYKEYILYNNYFNYYSGKVLIEIPHTRKVLSFFNGSVIFLPNLISEIKNVEKDFLKELFSIISQINLIDDKIVLPEWSKMYSLPYEQETINAIDEIQREIERQQKSLNDKQNILENSLKDKILFTGTGNELENKVRSIMLNLGFTVLPSEEHRDDLIVEIKGKIAVIEIKGVNGSAAEKHAAQLEKWVSGYLEANSVQAKGILIINAFKEIELKKRTEAFPHQMISYSFKREHCLITTTQLLGLYYDINEHPDKKEEIIDSLFETNGVYKGYEDWTKFITLS